MKYKKINMGAYNLHLIKTDKFKTKTISVNFREKIEKENITIRKLLFHILSSNCKKYNTNRLLQMELENLYSLNIGHSNLAFGNIINSYIDFKFLNNEFSDEKLLNDSFNLLTELLFNPNVENGLFDKKQFDIAKSRLQLILDSIKENTSKYALTRALEIMDETDPVSFSLWGYQKDLDSITPEALYEYYKNVLKTNKIDIFVVGNIKEKEIVELFEKKFRIKNNGEDQPEAFIIYNECPNTFIEEEIMDLKQSKLAIVCKVLDLSLFERRYVLPLYTSILGGCSTSRLFMNVREKNSLAYTIGSYSKTPNSMFFITAGIDEKNYKKTVKLVKDELYLDNITDKELESSKKEIISSLETLFDDPAGIINYYFGIEVFNADELEEKINSYNKVTKKDIINLSKKIKIAMIYLLKGVTDEKNKN